MKKLLIIAVVYVVILSSAAALSLNSDKKSYINYKKQIGELQKKLAAAVIPKDSSEDTEKDAPETEADKENLSGDESSDEPAQSQDYAEVQFRSNLKSGDTGEDVKKLQYILKSKKYYFGELTGNFDSKTEEAVMQFQQNEGLLVDGQVGPGTQAKLLE